MKIVWAWKPIAVMAMLVAGGAACGSAQETPVLMVWAPVRSGVQALPRIAHANVQEAKIQLLLDEEDSKAGSKADACRGRSDPEHPSTGHDMYFRREVDYFRTGSAVLAFVLLDTGWCRGPYPLDEHSSLVYNLRTGEPMRWPDIFPTGTVEESTTGEQRPVLLSARLQSLFAASYKANSDNCALEHILPRGKELFEFEIDVQADRLELYPTNVPREWQGCAEPLKLDAQALRRLGVSERWVRELFVAPDGQRGEDRAKDLETSGLVLLPVVRAGVQALPRIAHPNAQEAMINRALDQENHKGAEMAESCSGESDPDNPEVSHEMFYERTIEQVKTGPALLAFVLQDVLDCGGVHPVNQTTSLVYRLRTGKPMRWLDIFPKGIAVETKTDEGVMLRSAKLQALYMAGYPRNNKQCPIEDLVDGDASRELDFQITPDPDGLELLPTGVIQLEWACAGPVAVSARALRKLGVSEEWLRELFVPAAKL